MFGLGTTELLILLGIVLLVFGASKLPQLGEGLGKGIKNFKKALKDGEAIDVTPVKKEDAKEHDKANS